MVYPLSIPLGRMLPSSLRNSRVLSPGQSIALPILQVGGRVTYIIQSNYTTITTNQEGLLEGENKPETGLAKGHERQEDWYSLGKGTSVPPPTPRTSSRTQILAPSHFPKA